MKKYRQTNKNIVFLHVNEPLTDIIELYEKSMIKIKY